MELKDTVNMMISDDYKERFKAEYWQLRIRMEKLHRILCGYSKGTLEFEPNCPWHVLLMQKEVMNSYLQILEEIAESEKIEFEDINIFNNCKKRGVNHAETD